MRFGFGHTGFLGQDGGTPGGNYVRYDAYANPSGGEGYSPSELDSRGAPYYAARPREGDAAYVNPWERYDAYSNEQNPWETYRPPGTAVPETVFETLGRRIRDINLSAGPSLGTIGLIGGITLAAVGLILFTTSRR